MHCYTAEEVERLVYEVKYYYDAYRREKAACERLHVTLKELKEDNAKKLDLVLRYEKEKADIKCVVLEDNHEK